MTEEVAAAATSGFSLPKIDFANIDWGDIDWINLILWHVIIHAAVLAFLVFAAQQGTKLV